VPAISKAGPPVQVITGVFTPDGLQSDTTVENGILMPNPQLILDSGQFAQ
jgi:hypothetical protein